MMTRRGFFGVLGGMGLLPVMGRPEEPKLEPETRRAYLMNRFPMKAVDSIELYATGPANNDIPFTIEVEMHHNDGTVSFASHHFPVEGE
jgi:hypothetical protein